MDLQALKIRFYPKKKSGKAVMYSLYLRIIYKGQRAECSINYDLQREQWNDKRQELSLKNPHRHHVLNLTNQYRQKAMDIYTQMIQKGQDYTALQIIQRMKGKEEVQKEEAGLLQLFDQQIERKLKLRGSNNSIQTVRKYRQCRNLMAAFLKTKYKRTDTPFAQIDLSFIESFEMYLRSSGRYCNNSAMKHMQTFRAIYRQALSRGYIERDRFHSFKIKMEEVVRDFLDEEEIRRLIELPLPNDRLCFVRDMFVFSCYTGMAYVDVKNLQVRNIQNDHGKYWIRTYRQKTNTKANIPLLNIPLQVLLKYCPVIIGSNLDQPVFPMISNQKMNKYLKELATLAAIKKPLTFHIARHSFATSVTLNNDVPIESVSAMLGHKRISTTQHYAKLLDKKLERDMDVLRGKLERV